MHLSWQDFEDRLVHALQQRGIATASEIGWACVWLQACGYPGLTLLGEALADDGRTLTLTRDALGIDLRNISCLYLGPAVVDEVVRNGRAYLRNVRHGLYLLPFSVRHGLAIGCPVNPAFALGGSRDKNPYTEKVETAERDGLKADEAALQAIGA